MTQPVIQFDNLTGGYGRIPIVREVSGAIQEGQCLCVLGRNGVGKSTLIKLLSGHLPVMSGDIHILGKSAGNLPPEQRWALGMSVGLQERPVFDGLTVGDNLSLMQADRSLAGFETYFEAFPVLKSRLGQLAGTLSGGERKILSFVRAMKDATALTLLDEPSEGVQPENIDRMSSFIRQAKSEGRSFLVVEQHLHMAEDIADAYQVLDNGQIVLEGAAKDLPRSVLEEQIAI